MTLTRSTVGSEGLKVRPFLVFARWDQIESVQILAGHGLDPDIGSWAIEATARHYYRLFMLLTVPYIVLIAIYVTASTYGPTEFSHKLEESGPFPGLIALSVSWAWYWRGGRPHPAGAVHDILAMTEKLREFEEINFTIPPNGHRWPKHAEISASIEGTTQAIQGMAWKFSKKVAKIGGRGVTDHNDPRWTRTSRAVAYAAERPLNRYRRNVAYKACATHIKQLYAGRLFEPVPRNAGAPDPPALEPPRLTARIYEVRRATTTYTILATLIAASVGPLVTALLRRW